MTCFKTQKYYKLIRGRESNMKKILIENIRNISYLEFEIPSSGLHVLTGKNGMGKTTLFTCISRICNSNAYRIGFPSSANNTLDVFSGAITYSVDSNNVKYTKRTSGEWRPDKKNATVFQEFGYPEVINITTKDKRLFSQDMIVPRRNNAPDVWINEKMNTIFDTDKFTPMIRITTGDLRSGRGNVGENQRRNTAYAIPLGNNKYYTEQNFSFGEIVMINLLYDIKKAINGSMILIDELELALHPSAQIRLISCLKDLAREKGLTILISTHSSSIIKAEKQVIFLEQGSNNKIDVIYACPPAKAIGAIGMREDTNPDIIVLVEDSMANSFFNALKQKYFSMQDEDSFLDIRVLEIGGFQNVVHFYVEAKNYIFYENVYLVAFMDKDVETDIIPYSQYGNREVIQQYQENSSYLHFLPYTPEVFLVKTFYQKKIELLRKLSVMYSNQQLQYSLIENFDFENYEAALPIFTSQNAYNGCIEERGAFRKKCKKEAERIANLLAEQVNQSVEEIYRLVFKMAVDEDNGINIRSLLSPTMKRLRR